MVALVNPDSSEIELPIRNLVLDGDVAKFETVLETNVFHWTLTMATHGKHGVLHGTGGEMLIEEPERKQR
jgi:hypothetical protein